MTPGINTLLLSTGALGSFTCSGMTLLIYMGPTALCGIRATGDTRSNVESQVFTPYKFGSTAGDRTPDLLTTRPTCYHSATVLCSVTVIPLILMEHIRYSNDLFCPFSSSSATYLSLCIRANAPPDRLCLL